MTTTDINSSRTSLQPRPPGPQKEISVWGDKIEDLLFWVPNRAPVGVGVSFASYMGVVKIGLNVDAALVRSRREVSLSGTRFKADLPDLLRLEDSFC